MTPANDIRHYPGTRLFTVVVFLWLYLPSRWWSCTRSTRMAVGVWSGFSTKWYAAALANDALLTAVTTSLTVAVVSTLLATMIALAAAMVLMRTKALRHRRLSEAVINLPLLLPEIVVAVAVLILFSRIGLTNGTLRLVLAHTTFCTPFAFLPIRARLQGMTPTTRRRRRTSTPTRSPPSGG